MKLPGLSFCGKRRLERLMCGPAFAMAAMLLAASAQQTAVPRSPGLDAARDPANLAGERVSAPALADTLPIDHGAPALAQLLLKLHTRASLMMIVAHPDDEDGGMLAYESRGQGARVAMLTLNRGEGGQNLMSADFNDALGLIRTQELLGAGRYMGITQMFGSVVDFGFSKTREESLEQWGHDRVLYDTVRAVRLYRPLVLTSVFIGGVTDGHGQHQVAGEMNQEVFLAAADPKVFPEMGLPVWAPLKVYARTPFARIDAQGMFDYATGKSSPPRFYNYISKTWTETPPKADVLVHEGEASTAPGMEGQSYIQFARTGLGLQKSQIGNGMRMPQTGAFDSGYTLYGSRLAQSTGGGQTLFDGIDVSLAGIASLAPSAPPSLHTELTAGLGKIDASVTGAQRLFTVSQPELTAPPLRSALGILDTLIASAEKAPLEATEKFNLLHELRIKRVQCNDALALAHGLAVEATLAESAPGRSVLTTQASVAANVTATVGGKDHVSLKSLLLATPSGSHTQTVSGTSLSAVLRVDLPHGLSATRPYFSRPDLSQPYYDIAEPALRNAPATPAPLTVTATFDDGGVPLTVAAAVAYPSAPGAAMGSAVMRQAVSVVPPVSISLSQSAGIVPSENKSFALTAHVRNDTLEQTSGSVSLLLPSGKPVGNENPKFTLAANGDKTDVPFTIPSAAVGKQVSTLAAVATEKGHEYREGFRPVGYAGLVTTNFYTAAKYRVSVVDVRTAPGLRVGYLPGTGDDVAEYLPYLGVTPTLITAADLVPEKLRQYDAVLLGVRAYAAHPELAGAGSQALLDYTKNGGVVVVQYNTARYGDAQAPFPITVPGSSDMNVVVEADPVTLLVPGSPLFTWPNRITASDFDHWVEERGHGFARAWGAGYQALIETHDPEQDPEKGGLLLAHVGKGYYIYTALALYRQLPEGVPGAYRIMANLISVGKNPGFAASSAGGQ